jgi:hypothetical protein
MNAPELVREQPIASLAVALGAGFVAGGGLSARLWPRVASARARTVLGDLAAVAARELVVRGLEWEGARRVGAGARPA